MMPTQIIDDRESGLRIGYAATDWSAPISFEAYCAAVKDWIVKAIKRDDLIIGAVYYKDDEVHVSILPEWRRVWLTKGILREFFSRSRITTKVTPGHEYMYDILKRLGFKELNSGLLVKEN